MNTTNSLQAAQDSLFQHLGDAERASVHDFACWLLHRAHRPDEYGQDKADACASAWHLLIQYKQEKGI